MNKGQLYVELVKKNLMKDAISVIRGKKNRFSKEEVAVALGNKKSVIKMKKQKVIKKQEVSKNIKEESIESNLKKKSKKKFKK